MPLLEGVAPARPDEIDRPTRRSVLLYALPIFLGAFLLFQVQLLIGKYILPWFGGTAAVWTTCLLAFQLLLLGGYGYAHWLKRRPGRQQTAIHLSLLLISLFFLAVAGVVWPAPITPGADWKPSSLDHPIAQILVLLLSSVALPYLVLSTTSPLLQQWFGETHRGLSPYRLYALSNLGSLLGLLSYPFLVEPALTVRAQAWLWSALYLLFAILVGACASTSRIAAASAVEADPPPTEAPALPGYLRFSMWFLLAACASSMLLATSNYICQDVAAVPFLWVLPLSLYLVSFIICFDHPRWYKRGIWYPLYGGVLLLVSGRTAEVATTSSLIILYSAALFCVCMLCHGELVRLRPAASRLTGFYLVVAAGGAAGGLFVALVAPRVFSGFWEYFLTLWAAGLLVAIVLAGDRGSWLWASPVWLPWAVLLGVALLPVLTSLALGVPLTPRPAWNYAYAAVAISLALAVGFLSRQQQQPQSGRHFRWIQPLVLSLMLLGGAGLLMRVNNELDRTIARSRNFFGVLKVKTDANGSQIILMHGAITHGVQLIGLSHQPTGYYASNSGIGLLLGHHPKRAAGAADSRLRVGVLGLGAGALVAWGQPGDYFRFYEINPAVYQFSSGPDPMFTYLRDARAKVDIVMGDARLSLEQEASRGDLQQFDILAVDVFSGDSVPAHLLTREALQLYRKHLNGPRAVVALHISNRVLDLAPVAKGLCQDAGMYCWFVTNKDSDWVLASADAEALAIPELRRAGHAFGSDVKSLVWTDQFSNLLAVLKW